MARLRATLTLLKRPTTSALRNTDLSSLTKNQSSSLVSVIDTRQPPEPFAPRSTPGTKAGIYFQAMPPAGHECSHHNTFATGSSLAPRSQSRGDHFGAHPSTFGGNPTRRSASQGTPPLRLFLRHGHCRHAFIMNRSPKTGWTPSSLLTYTLHPIPYKPIHTLPPDTQSRT